MQRISQMKNVKKSSYLTRTLLLLIIIAVSGVIYTSFKDFTLSPTEQFELAQKAEKENSPFKAERYYLMASTSSDKNVSKLAAYYLGNLYRLGGNGFPINGPKAEMFLEQAALQNLPQAQYELALMYDVGDKILENREKAARWMNLAAQNGYIDAIYSLGVWVERGYLGEPDMQKVLALYEQAAQHGHIYAITSLIALYSGGSKKVEPNPEKATYWMNKIVEMNKQGSVQTTQKQTQSKTK